MPCALALIVPVLVMPPVNVETWLKSMPDSPAVILPRFVMPPANVKTLLKSIPSRLP